jgi:hypothetical protein
VKPVSTKRRPGDGGLRTTTYPGEEQLSRP